MATRPKPLHRFGLVAAIGGLLIIPYAVWKGPVTAQITDSGWHVLGLSPAATALSIHLLEAVPVAMMLVGFLALESRCEASDLVRAVGFVVAAAGFSLVIAVHTAEHLLPPLTVPALTGSTDWLLWGYYASWLVLYAGLVAFGLAIWHRTDLGSAVPAALLLLPVAGVCLGLVAVAVEAFTFAGTIRITTGVTFAVVGYGLWTGGERAPRSRRAPEPQ